MKKYTKTHEWLEIKDGVAYVGISRHAAQELGEIVFVQLPEVGATVAAGAAACEIESVKAVAEVNSAVDGPVGEVNTALEDAPEFLSEDSDAWILSVAPSASATGLMSEEEYKEVLG